MRYKSSTAPLRMARSTVLSIPIPWGSIICGLRSGMSVPTMTIKSNIYSPSAKNPAIMLVIISCPRVLFSSRPIKRPKSIANGVDKSVASKIPLMPAICQWTTAIMAICAAMAPRITAKLSPIPAVTGIRRATTMSPLRAMRVTRSITTKPSDNPENHIPRPVMATNNSTTMLSNKKLLFMLITPADLC